MNINELIELTDSIYKPCYEHKNAFVLYAFTPIVKRTLLPRSLQNEIAANKSRYCDMLKAAYHKASNNKKRFEKWQPDEQVNELIEQALDRIRWRVYRADYTVSYFSDEQIVYSGKEPSFTLMPYFIDFQEFIDTEGRYIVGDSPEDKERFKGAGIAPQFIDSKKDFEALSKLIHEELLTFLDSNKALTQNAEELFDFEEVTFAQTAKETLLDTSKATKNLMKKQNFEKAKTDEGLKLAYKTDKRGKPTAYGVVHVTSIGGNFINSDDDEIQSTISHIGYYEYAVLAAINTLIEQSHSKDPQKKYIVLTTDTIFRQMTGAVGSRNKAGPRATKEIDNAVKRMKNLSLFYSGKHFDGQEITIEDTILNCKPYRSLNKDGTLSERGYMFVYDDRPILFRISQSLNHIARLPTTALRSNKFSATKDNIAIRCFILLHIQNMIRKGDKSYTVYYSDLYNKTEVNTADRRSTMKARDTAKDILKGLSVLHNFTYYEKTDPHNKNKAISIIIEKP
jgi:hypothetical protein